MCGRQYQPIRVGAPFFREVDGSANPCKSSSVLLGGGLDSIDRGADPSEQLSDDIFAQRRGGGPLGHRPPPGDP